MTNFGCVSTWVLTLALVMLTNDCCILTIKDQSLGKNQRSIIKRTRKGNVTEYEVDFLQCLHHNVKYIIKYCEVLMPRDKFEHIFGFTSMKDMSADQKVKFYEKH